jgi:predicted metal-dependent hydrolase
MFDSMMKLTEQQQMDGAVRRKEFDEPRQADSFSDEMRAKMREFVSQETPKHHRFVTRQGKQAVVYFDPRGRAVSAAIDDMSDEDLAWLYSTRKRMQESVEISEDALGGPFQKWIASFRKKLESEFKVTEFEARPAGNVRAVIVMNVNGNALQMVVDGAKKYGNADSPNVTNTWINTNNERIWGGASLQKSIEAVRQALGVAESIEKGFDRDTDRTVAGKRTEDGKFVVISVRGNKLEIYEKDSGGVENWVTTIPLSKIDTVRDTKVKAAIAKHMAAKS